MNSQDMVEIKNLVREAVRQGLDDNKTSLAYKVAEEVWTTRGWEHRIECPESLKEYAIRNMIRSETIATIALVDKLKTLPLQEHITALKGMVGGNPDLRQYILAQL